MKKLSDEQREQLAKGICDEWCDTRDTSFYDDKAETQKDYWRKTADAAYAYLAPILYAEAQAELSYEEKVYVWGEYIALERAASCDRDSQLFKVINGLLKRRLARLTAPAVDPAVEAVKGMLKKDFSGAWCLTGSAEEVVARVRAADKESTREK